MTSTFICLFVNLVSLRSFTSLENWSIWLPNNDNSSSYLKLSTAKSQIISQRVRKHVHYGWLTKPSGSLCHNIIHWLYCLHTHTVRIKPFYYNGRGFRADFLYGGSRHDWGTISRIHPALQDRPTVSTTTPYQCMNVKTVLVKVSSALARRWTHKPYIMTYSCLNGVTSGKWILRFLVS